MIGGTTVLTNTQGFTLYLFAPDTPATSKCYGSCAAYWPPVTGPAAADPGVPGRVGTIIRTGGARQLTYNGHPLYTYIGDSAPGQARGNNLNLNGGLWQEVRVSLGRVSKSVALRHRLAACYLDSECPEARHLLHDLPLFSEQSYQVLTWQVDIARAPEGGTQRG
jgi:predicted lipoprotein with Yx(FWY)xxD motif